MNTKAPEGPFSGDIIPDTPRISPELRGILNKVGMPDSDIDLIIPDSELPGIVMNLGQNPNNETEKRLFIELKISFPIGCYFSMYGN